MTAILSLNGIACSVGNQVILRDITLSVPAGAVIGVIGPNGSGKTTLFNVLSGFLRPTTGSMTLKGEDITALGAAERAQRGIGRVFQNFGVFREMTLAENVLVAFEALPPAQRQALGNLSDAVHATLSMVGLAAHADQKAGSLSGGQMRLLEIARTLQSGKDIFLLDEPTAGVSPKMTQQVAALIEQLKEAKKTILIIEHDLPFISRLCDQVIVLDIGQIVLTGSPAQVQRSRALQEIYFGADPTT